MTRWAMQHLEGWGRYPKVESLCARPERHSELTAALADREGDPVLAYALGRSYGDTALLTGGRTILTERMDRMLAFDEETGWLTCEGGVSIKSILDTFVSRGFFAPVVPGTQFVSVGGALANDIHGKNHHCDGTWADHVRNVRMLIADGSIVVCDATQNADLFWATVGGMGLTGIILSMDVRLYRVANSFVEMETIRIENLDHFLEISAESKDFTHTVSWIDCTRRGDSMGRGVFMRGRHAPEGTSAPPSVVGRMAEVLSPLLEVRGIEPDWLLNRASIAIFNEAYFRKAPKGCTPSVTHYEPFFFPLDFVRGWNRLYGKRGFLQYQFVVPRDPELRAVRAALDLISRSGMASFLSVIKEFGDAEHGGLSFPSPGVTLALDFPNFGEPLLQLMERLDAIVLEAGGRVYLGKDARLPLETFRAMYPGWETWKATRDAWDPDGVFQSDLGRRLGLV